MFNKLKEKRIELFVFLIYVVGYILISAFHEPWFDEAQAWQIAKCANIKDILFEIPHYEGHPPLWHLILAIPAKLGVPFEIGLKGVGFVISSLSVFLLLFRTKLPRYIKLLLPFSYFFFYQYGVIVRPYCLTLLTMILLGMNYDKWNIHPWRIVFLLSFLCLTCAYGIVLAGGIAICLVLDVIQEKGFIRFFCDLFKDQRTQALLLLLVFAIVLILDIIPRTDTYSPIINEKNSFLVCLICSLFTFPEECFLTTGSWFYVDRVLLQNATISISELIIFSIIGLFLWLFIICISSKRNLKLLIIPYLLFSVFSSEVYFTCHHLGIALAFFLFWFEVQFRDDNRFEVGQLFVSKIAKTERDHHLLQKLAIGISCVCLLVPIYWTILSSSREVKTNYGYGREISLFIKENCLDDKLILTRWSIFGSIIPQAEGHEDYINPYTDGIGTVLSAYFTHNMSITLNNRDDRKAFTYHKFGSYTDSLIYRNKWKAQGIPELIIGKPVLEYVYGDKLDYSDYALVKIIRYNYIWKGNFTSHLLPIFVQNNLVSQYNLQPISGIDDFLINGLTITGEMKEQYESGIPVEEIIKPYLDAVFGEEDK